MKVYAYLLKNGSSGIMNNWEVFERVYKRKTM